MAKKQKRKQKQKQKQTTRENAEQKERRLLKAKIAFLQRVPNSFRDIEVGSNDWECYAKLLGKREEMETWSNGLVLCREEPSMAEKQFFGKGNYRVEKVDLLTCLVYARAINASWLYLPDEEGPIIKAINMLAAHDGAEFRARGPLLSEHTGKRVGTTY